MFLACQGRVFMNNVTFVSYTGEWSSDGVLTLRIMAVVEDVYK